MKMYIFIKDNVPNDFVPVVAAHASLACYLTFENEPLMKEWQKTSFKKVICTVDENNFQHLKGIDKSNVTTESSLGGNEVAISFCPRTDEVGDTFKYYKLWKYKMLYR